MTAAAVDRRCSPDDVGIEFTDDAPAELRATIADYLGHFDAPIRRNSIFACSCGAGLTGMFGTFTWGLTHGDGFCGGCRRPARAYHTIRDNDGELISFRCVLLYAPLPEGV